MCDPPIPCEEIPKYERRIQELLSRATPESDLPTKYGQRRLYEAARRASHGSQQRVLPRVAVQTEFENELIQRGAEFNNRSNFITDFCYNLVNLEDNPTKFLVCVGRGLFQFRDLAWLCPDEVSITWKVARRYKIDVGMYVNGKYTWQFGELEALIRASKAK